MTVFQSVVGCVTSMIDFKSHYITPPAWGIGESIAFSFSVITVLGFGNTGVHTKPGQIFYLLYACLGIPLNMLILANVGKFISSAVATLPSKIRATKCCTWVKNKRKLTHGLLKNSNSQSLTPDYVVDTPVEEEEPPDEDLNAKPFLFIFGVYMVTGCTFMLLYRTGGDPIVALYATFRAITADFASMMPDEIYYLPLGLVYVAFGLILFTMAIDVASVYLRRLNAVGKKLQNVGNVKIWFGGKCIKVDSLVEQLCETYEIPLEQRQQMNLLAIVEETIENQDTKNKSFAPRAQILRNIPTVDEFDSYSFRSPSPSHSLELPSLSRAVELQDASPRYSLAIPFECDPFPGGDCLMSPVVYRGLNHVLVEFRNEVRVSLIKSDVIEGRPGTSRPTPEAKWPKKEPPKSPSLPKSFDEAHEALVNDPLSLHQLYLKEWTTQAQLRQQSKNTNTKSKHVYRKLGD